MEFCRLNERQLAYAKAAGRTPEAVALREQVLRYALAELDAAIRKSPIDKVQVLQGYARAIADVIELLTVNTQPSQSASRRLAPLTQD